MRRYTRKNSLRLKDYDYSKAGAYFVTILAHKRLYLFGHIADDQVQLSKLGHIVQQYWQQIPQHYAHVELDASVIMPNHMYGIIALHDGVATSLSHIINTFKGAVTRQARRTELDIDLDCPVWHRNFHDRIIRNKWEYDKILAYVHNNPKLWDKDTFYE